MTIGSATQELGTQRVFWCDQHFMRQLVGLVVLFLETEFIGRKNTNRLKKMDGILVSLSVSYVSTTRVD